MNGRTHTHTQTRATKRRLLRMCVSPKGTGGTNETLEAEVVALHLTRPEGDTHTLSTADTLGQMPAPTGRHGVYVICEKYVESERERGRNATCQLDLCLLSNAAQLSRP